MSRKKDSSPVIHQRDKLKNLLEIKDVNWTDKQKAIIDTVFDKKTKLVIIDGPPGSTKTFLAVYCSLRMLSEKKVGELVFVRSLVQASDGETGFLPGLLQDRTQYYNIPLMDKLNELLTKPDIDKLIKENRLITYPTSMLRGYQFSCEAVINDESQNCTFDSLYTIATRMGQFSKLFLLGDSNHQNDLGKKSGFREFCQIFSDEESKENGIHYFKLDTSDIKRSGLVKFIVEKVDKFKENLRT